MYFYLYKTVCLVTNKYYVGVHITKNLNDGYLGSGTILKRSIKKYGKENHQKEILEYFFNKKEMFLKESNIVNTNLLQDKFCMNLILGGSGNGGFKSIQQQINATKASVVSQKYLYENDSNWLKNKSLRQSKSLKIAYKNGRKKPTKWPEKALINAQSKESKQKRLDTLKKIQHSQGEKNPQYGTCWVSNNVQTVKIKIELLEEYISKGYIRGRKLIVLV